MDTPNGTFTTSAILQQNPAAISTDPSVGNLIAPVVTAPRPRRMTIFTLRIDDYAPQICELTYPLIKAWAHKIGAEFYTITKRRWPDMPPVYEKLQIHELAREVGGDWFTYIDSDALVHPDMFDPTDHVPMDTVFHNGNDMAGNRWRYDEYFRRDGRHIGSCNWLAGASKWCLDLWRPLEGLTYEQALANIFPIVTETNSGVIKPSHLIDDYTLSRNIARFGLKFVTINDLLKTKGISGTYFWHVYCDPIDVKVTKMKQVLKEWKLL